MKMINRGNLCPLPNVDDVVHLQGTQWGPQDTTATRIVAIDMEADTKRAMVVGTEEVEVVVVAIEEDETTITTIVVVGAMMEMVAMIMGKMMAEIVDPRESATIIIQMDTATNMQDMNVMMIETIDTDPTSRKTEVAVMEADEVLIEAVTAEEDVVVGAAEVEEEVSEVMGEGTKMPAIHPIVRVKI